MDLGITSVIPDPGAPRQQSPVIDQRPEATVQPAEPDARNEAAGRNRQGSAAPGPSPAPAPGEPAPLPPSGQPSSGQGPAAAGGPGPQQRLSNDTARALSGATSAGGTADGGADALRNRAAEAYLESVQRASTSRPALDFQSGAQTGGNGPTTAGDDAPPGRLAEASA